VATGFVDRAVENGVIKISDEDGFVPKREPIEDTDELGIAE
jgi:hypothetical protein